MKANSNIHQVAIGSFIALAGLCTAASAQGLFDFARTKTESRETFLVYDLPGFNGAPIDLQNRVREALTYQGDHAYMKENLQTGEAPRFPGKLILKPLATNLPISITFPICDGAAFTAGSSDNSMASYGDSARYMACGFPYAGGYRVNFYASYSTTSGGVSGIFSGKTIGKVFTDAIGMSSDPQKFIESSVAKMEELFTASGWTFALVEMKPVIAGKTVSEDPLVRQQVSEQKRGADRGKRMAARAELNKLAIDASDRARFVRAIQSNDEDLVELFVEAGAVDLSSIDESGKSLADYAIKPGIRALLMAQR